MKPVKSSNISPIVATNTVSPGSTEGNIASLLRHRILSGYYSKGELLPGERSLATELSVSRLTLRAAFSRLQTEGLLRPEHGLGTRVLDFRQSGGIEVLVHLVRQALQNPQQSQEAGLGMPRLLKDVLELRRMLAVEILMLVTERATASQIRELRSQHAQLQAAVDDGQAFIEADLQFARSLTQATENIGLELLFNAVGKSLTEAPEFRLAFMVNTRETVKTYDKLLQLVESRDPRRMQKVAKRILERLDRLTIDRMTEFLGKGNDAKEKK